MEDSFGEGPESKKSAAINDPFGAQLAQRRSNMAGTEMGGVAPPTEIMMVPDKMVGLIIGRGGEQITRLQAETGCKIQMAQDSAGMAERQCTISGSPANIAVAKQAIEKIIANEGNGPPRGPPGGMPPPGGSLFEIPIPGHKVGLIIGKGGENIKMLQERSGAKIIIVQESAEQTYEKPLRITGTPEAVEQAKQLVTDMLNQHADEAGGFGRGRGRGGPPRGRGGFMGRGGPRGGGRGGFGGSWGAPGGGAEYGAEHTDYVTVPSNKCGLVIGKGGETIKNINATSGAHCELDKSAPPDAMDKNFIIRGSVDSVERAKSMILEKLGMAPGGSAYYGSPSAGAQWGASGESTLI